jgi:hypothetical protein
MTGTRESGRSTTRIDRLRPVLSGSSHASVGRAELCGTLPARPATADGHLLDLRERLRLEKPGVLGRADAAI